VGELDGEPVVIIMQRGVDTWTAYSVVSLDLAGHQIARIRDYSHCPWARWRDIDFSDPTSER